MINFRAYCELDVSVPVHVVHVGNQGFNLLDLQTIVDLQESRWRSRAT